MIELILEKLTSATIIQKPFPHLLTTDVFGQTAYSELLASIPARSQFSKSVYPGVGMNRSASNVPDYGLSFEGFSSTPSLDQFYAFLKSPDFSRALLEKFSQTGSNGTDGTAIPETKHKYFADGSTDFTCVFDLHKDLPGYEISPHRDVPEKIVTFLFYLTALDTTPACSTLLCRVKDGVTKEMLAEPGGPEGKNWRWHKWEYFDIVHEVEARPNVYFLGSSSI